jgi:hypothetical protein
MEAATQELACCIGDLPDELLIAVVSQLRVRRGYLADDDAEAKRRIVNTASVRSLYALSSSCRKLHAIATPLLYQCIIQSQLQPYMPVLLRTLVSKPELAQHIQYIEFESLEPLGQTPCDAYTESDLCKLREIVSTIQWLVPFPETTAELMADRGGERLRQRLIATLVVISRFSDALGTFVVLLSFANNIRDIALPHGVHSFNILAYWKFAQPSKFRRFWSKGIDMSWFSGSFMHWEKYSLRALTAKPEGQYGVLTDYLRRLLLSESTCLNFGPPAAMEEVSLTVYDAQIEHLDFYLKDCALLERFTCRWKWTDQFTPEYEVDLPALRNSLQHVQKTLIDLTIDTMESAWRVDINRIVPPIGSLREFNALKHLDVAGLVLWGDDDTSESPALSSLLPQSLETLAIKTEWDDDIEDALYQLSVDCTDFLPNLKKVECTWRPAPRFVAEYLVDACRQEGVELILDIDEDLDP